MVNKQYNPDIVDNISDTLCEIVNKGMGNIYFSSGDAAPLIEIIKSKVD